MTDMMAYLAANATRYEEIKHLRGHVTRTGSAYAESHYTVVIDDETRNLSDHDLIVLCDEGNACFGGAVRSRFGGVASVAVYTD